jgi:sucrose phosphorylase
MNDPSRLQANLRHLYGARAEEALAELRELWAGHGLAATDAASGTEMGAPGGPAWIPGAGDVALIAYADSIRGSAGSPLAAQRRFVQGYLAKAINTLHLLPFFPWDTDRGFSVQDYRAVDPRNGTWDEIEALAREFTHLMVDLVINHASLDNPLVQGALTGDPRYRDFVIRYADGAQPDAAALAQLTRPRPDPVLTRYYVVATGGHKEATFDRPLADGMDDGSAGPTGGWVWTTFSRPPNADGSAATRQVDLNFRNPRVLLEMLEVLLCYRGHGADWVRLDAAGYMWKELGTPSIHHPNTHRLLQVLRDALAGRADLVTVAEVNEPQDAVLPYLGSTDAGVECDLAYQFAHFPLAVHALLSGDARHYKRWVGTLEPFAGRQFVTVFGSHDGMGRKPVLGLLPDDDLERMVQDLVAHHGALPNYARQAGGERIIYELCATPWSLINRADADEPLQLQVDRYTACAALGLTLRGVPAFYLNGLLGVPNRLDPRGLDENRSINREQFDETALYAELDNPGSQMRLVLERLLRLIEVRTREPAFAPGGPPLEILDSPAAVVAVVAAGGGRRVLALTNVSASPQRIRLETSQFPSRGSAFELITGAETTVPAEPVWELSLAPYEVRWLTATR